jgi:hypothetical protein
MTQIDIQLELCVRWGNKNKRVDLFVVDSVFA